jgi:hypothetical protein
MLTLKVLIEILVNKVIIVNSRSGKDWGREVG